MTNLPNRHSPDLADLFEYDEFDDLDDPRKDFNVSPERGHGVPLSVELQQSTSAQNGITSPQSFVQAAELFLRIESAPIAGNASKSELPKNDSIQSDDNQCPAQDDVELHYENEISTTDDDDRFVVSSPRPSTVVNDIEQLLLEGIVEFRFWQNDSHSPNRPKCYLFSFVSSTAVVVV